MFQELVNEIKLGKKMYLFQLISLALFIAFLMGSDYVANITGIAVVNGVLLAWMLVNAAAISGYMVISYIKVLLKELPSGENLGRTILFKILLFIFWFSMNSFVFLTSAGMSIPAFALVLTFMIVIFANKTGMSRRMLITVGLIWFLTFFLILYFAYPLILMILMNLINNQVMANMIVSLFYFSLTIVCFLKTIRMTNAEITNKDKRAQTIKSKNGKN